MSRLEEMRENFLRRIQNERQDFTSTLHPKLRARSTINIPNALKQYQQPSISVPETIVHQKKQIQHYHQHHHHQQQQQPTPNQKHRPLVRLQTSLNGKFLINNNTSHQRPITNNGAGLNRAKISRVKSLNNVSIAYYSRQQELSSTNTININTNNLVNMAKNVNNNNNNNRNRNGSQVNNLKPQLIGSVNSNVNNNINRHTTRTNSNSNISSLGVVNNIGTNNKMNIITTNINNCNEGGGSSSNGKSIAAAAATVVTLRTNPDKHTNKRTITNNGTSTSSNQTKNSLQCKHCNRKFSAKDRLDKHMDICVKIFKKHRPIFQSAKQRSLADGKLSSSTTTTSTTLPTISSSSMSNLSESKPMPLSNIKNKNLIEQKTIAEYGRTGTSNNNIDNNNNSDNVSSIKSNWKEKRKEFLEKMRKDRKINKFNNNGFIDLDTIDIAMANLSTTTTNKSLI